MQNTGKVAIQKLKAGWITDGIIDFEHKKYVLLAYLQQIGKRFDEQKLYPFLADLIFHFRSLHSLKESKTQFKNSLPKRISKVDLERFTFKYEKMMADDDQMAIIEEILEFAIPRLESCLKNGQEIYEEVEDKLEIEPIGVLPLNKDFGYMLLLNGQDSSTKVYEYQLSVIHSIETRFRAVRLAFVREYKRQFTNTSEAIKLDLIKTNKELPNPATYRVLSGQQYPIIETLLPVAKRTLVRYICT